MAKPDFQFLCIVILLNVNLPDGSPSLFFSASVRDSILEKSTSLIHGAYKSLYDVINNPGNGYSEPQGIVPRTPDQVKRLLQ